MGSDKTGALEENSILLEMPSKKIEQWATANPKFEKDYDNFHKMTHTEPHSVRRRQILEKHPEIEKLFKKEPFTMVWVILMHVIQMTCCYVITKYDISWSYIIPFALVFGAVPNHALFVLIHDITHFNAFRSLKMTQIGAIFANLPQIIPSAIGFQIYHKEHHHFLGDEIYDPDIPTMWEIKFFKTSFRRLCYILSMPFFYGFRPYYKAPKNVSVMEIVNAICNITYAIILVQILGKKALLYLLLCTYFGLSVHPVAAHVIAEHYEFFKSQDTFSYYGWINYLNFNMGYHIEHHDFPNIAWNKLPEVRKIAPEFYNNLPEIDSYITVIYKYIFDSSIGPWSRVTIEAKAK